jgi:hypothetical protein
MPLNDPLLCTIDFFDVPVVQCAVEEEEESHDPSLLYGESVNVRSSWPALILEHVEYTPGPS